ncbi:integrase [Zhihengliuella halotolerans]|uniref:integrase n=1 Tax=Zhihengliuella halotolerans TaxID=370736 RepID=UPI000C80D38E|nr:integrase [Zhihengliuella halotolerans]
MAASKSAKPRTSRIIGQDIYATHIATRLQDFFLASAPWQRRLWEAGTLSTLTELLDASRWQSEGVLHSSMVKLLATDLATLIAKDPGIGGPKKTEIINAELSTNVPYGSGHWQSLDQLTEQAKRQYLKFWRDAIDSNSPPGAERAARAIAATLLDTGYSMSMLHGWITNHIENCGELGEMLESADSLRRQKPTKFTVAIPFTSMPRANVARSNPAWRDAPAIKLWLGDSRKALTKGVYFMGGFRYDLSAMDEHSALQEASAIRGRILSRSSFVPGYRNIAPAGIVWILNQATGVTRQFPLEEAHRGIFLHSLGAGDRVHAVGSTASRLDDALELASSLNNSSSPGPPIVNGWSALEALLFSSGNPKDVKKGRGPVAIARAALLSTCSWPRAELTSLSYSKRQDVTALDIRLEGAASNHERCGHLLHQLRTTENLSLSDSRDRAAQERMLELIKDESGTLKSVRRQMELAFRRLYRNRNIVVHGGAASAQTLAVAIRTTAPLVGAVLDRLVHA